MPRLEINTPSSEPSPAQKLRPELRAHALSERTSALQKDLDEISRLYGHLVTHVQVAPDGTYRIHAEMPKEGEIPGVTVEYDDQAPNDQDLRGPFASWDEYAEAATDSIPQPIRHRHEMIQEDADLLVEALGDEPITHGVATALKKASQDIVEVARRAGAHQTGLTPTEVARAQRDLFFLEQAAIQALGVRDDYESRVASGTSLQFRKHAQTGRGKHSFTYHVKTETLDFEGDHDDANQELVDYYWAEGTPYTGELEIAIDPEKRISISYRPDQARARLHHTTEDVVQRGDKLVHHRYDDLNLRIDLDPKSPSGLAVDVGRSEFVASDAFVRDTDLLGKVMQDANPQTGSHVYEGFTADMLPSFKPMAERLIARLSLGFSEHEHAVAARQAQETLADRSEKNYLFGAYGLYLAGLIREQKLHLKRNNDRLLDDDRSRYTRGY